MRTIPIIVAAAIAIAALPPAAQAQNPSQLLQGLLSGNQGQDQAVREAYERGYRQGRQDQVRDDRDRVERDRNDRRGPPPPRGPYPDQDPNQQYQRNQYGR